MGREAFNANMTVHQFVTELRALGAIIDRPDAAPNNILIKYRGKRIFIRGHGEKRRIGDAVWLHLHTLGVKFE